MPTSMVESNLISSEESIMATFDFLSAENVVDDDNLSDGENEDGQGEDENEDRILVKRPKLKVSNCLLKSVIIDNLCRIQKYKESSRL